MSWVLPTNCKTKANANYRSAWTLCDWLNSRHFSVNHLEVKWHLPILIWSRAFSRASKQHQSWFDHMRFPAHESKINFDLVTCVFPRLKATPIVSWSHTFSCAWKQYQYLLRILIGLLCSYVCSDWPEWLLCLRLTTLIWKPCSADAPLLCKPSCVSWGVRGVPCLGGGGGGMGGTWPVFCVSVLSWNTIPFNREVYHTRRMQRVFCVRFSADSTYVLSGSDETNIRYDEKKKNDTTAIQTSFCLQFWHFYIDSLVFFSSKL